MQRKDGLAEADKSAEDKEPRRSAEEGVALTEVSSLVAGGAGGGDRLLLFGGEVVVHHDRGTVTIDREITFEAPGRVSVPRSPPGLPCAPSLKRSGAT